jgi:hypothetical protein
MSKLTEADIVEMRRLYGNKKMSLREIAQLFHVHHSTVAEVINHCNPTKSTAPFKQRACEPTESDTVGQHAPLAVVQEPARTEALVIGAQNEGRAIMAKLDELLQGQDARLNEVLKAERDFKEAQKDKHLDSEERYLQACQMNKDYNIAILGLKSTLHQMAELSRSINIFVDNRKILNVTYEQLPPQAQARMDEAVTERLIGDMWPLMCPECKARFIALTKEHGNG